MLHRCDAALLIGDPALFLDHQRLGASKIDLGEEWKALTGLPFVWAFWAGRRDALLERRGRCAGCRARPRASTRLTQIAAAYCGPERAARGRSYLRENIQYTLGSREQAGLMKILRAGRSITAWSMPSVPPLFYR